MVRHNIYPALLDSSEDGLLAKLKTVKAWKTPIHLDIVDGVFAAPRSAQGKLLKKVPAGSSVHLMVKNPTKYFAWAKKVGFRTLVVHIEGNDVLSTCRRRPKGVKMVAAIKSTTPIAKLEPWVRHIDGVHVMMGPIGSAGTGFHPKNAKRVVGIHAKYPQLPITCDDGMNQKSIPLVFNSGAAIAVAGSYIFRAKKPIERWETLQRLLKKL